MLTLTFFVGSNGKMSISNGSSTGTTGMQSGPGQIGRAWAVGPVTAVPMVVMAVVASIAPARNRAVRRMAELGAIEGVEGPVVFIRVLLGLVPLFTV